MNTQKGPLSVSELNEYLKMLLDGDRLLSSVFVRGEISNFTVAGRSGHLYFTLKDEEGQIRSVMFRSYADRLRFRPEDGMRVIVHGHVSLYGPSGQYQLYADELLPDGIGTLAMQYEQLRRRLQAEGLFDEARKKTLPSMPQRVGIITSPVGAAIHDIMNISKRRFPCAELILFPSQVQGGEAAEQLISGLVFFEMTKVVDVIIIGRGGGSAEDLWAFNDEMLARQIAACTIPVISAVGHESDFTICDFVADLRAPTPSAAAEIALPDGEMILQTLRRDRDRLTHAMRRKVENYRNELETLKNTRVFQQPQRLLEPMQLKLSNLETSLDRAANSGLEIIKGKLGHAVAKLEALSPLSVLKRGYAVVSKEEHAVTSVSDVAIGDELQIRFADGTVNAKAITKDRLES